MMMVFHFNLPVCFLKTGMRPIKGNFLPGMVVFFVAFDFSDVDELFFVSFLSLRRSRDRERLRSRRLSRLGLRLYRLKCTYFNIKNLVPRCHKHDCMHKNRLTDEEMVSDFCGVGRVCKFPTINICLNEIKATLKKEQIESEILTYRIAVRGNEMVTVLSDMLLLDVLCLSYL